MTARIEFHTDFLAPGFSPAETAEARIDPDQEADNARDSWDGDWR